MNFFNSHLISYLVPKNLNVNWNFGFVLGILCVFQIFTGFLLTFFYVPHKEEAFDSVVTVMSEVNFGWYIRLYHSIGVSFYFSFMFIHIIKGMWYSSKYLPWSWYSGMAILILSIATAFIGYVLPDGQMSFWGATVIANLLKWLGKANVIVFGGYTIGAETLQRFYVFHVVLPFVILFLVIIHLYFLHREGSTNPLSSCDAVVVSRFYPVALVSDIKLIVIIILLIGIQVGYGVIQIFQADPDNSLVSDPLVTPAHIVPEWYLLLFYATLKVFPTKLSGLLAMASVLELLVLLVEARSCTPVVAAACYHRVWTMACTFIVPVLFMLGCIGKMVINHDLMIVGLGLVLLVIAFIFKLLDSARIRR